MKLYRIVTGYGIDEYGYCNHQEIAKYFLDENAAKAFFKTGEFTLKVTQITTTFKDGTTSVGTTGASWYESYKKRAASNEKVELVEVVENNYRFEEIETED